MTQQLASLIPIQTRKSGALTDHFLPVNKTLPNNRNSELRSIAAKKIKNKLRVGLEWLSNEISYLIYLLLALPVCNHMADSELVYMLRPQY